MKRIVLRGPRGERWHTDVAVTRRERTRGLLGLDALLPGRALLIPCVRSVHTFGMRFPITVALLGGDLRVLAVRRLPPRRLLLPRRRVRHVLECAEGADIREEDVLREEGPVSAGRKDRRAT